MGTWGKRVLSRGNGQCKGPEEAGQYPVCLCNSEEAHVAGAEGMREGGEEVRQGGDKKDIVCRAVGRTWACTLREVGSLEYCERSRCGA